MVVKGLWEVEAGGLGVQDLCQLCGSFEAALGSLRLCQSINQSINKERGAEVGYWGRLIAVGELQFEIALLQLDRDVTGTSSGQRTLTA